MTFVVLSLPRSRSAWAARFLSYGDWICGHEEARHMCSLDDVRTWFKQPCIGSAETAVAPFWRLLDNVAPGCRVAVIRRPVSEVFDSLMALPVAFDQARLIDHLAAMDRKLDQIAARYPGALSVTFDELGKEDACAALFEHCLPYRHDSGHWASLANVNVQCDMVAMMRHATAFAPQLAKLAAVAKHQTLSAMAVRETVSDGFTFQTETFDTWVSDAQKLFDSHLVQVGEAPGDWQKKNLPLMRQIYDVGAMQITTARANGRMFGYLMTIIAPSLTSENVTSATNTTFYASPDAPGIGLKLQRAALKFLQERGVDDVFFEAGKRGDGPRLSALYRRMGAVEHGQAYRLELRSH